MIPRAPFCGRNENIRHMFNLANLKRFVGIGILGFALGTTAAAPVSASEFFSYRDSKGVWHFTNAPADARYRPFSVKTMARVGLGKRKLNAEALKPYVNAAAQTYRLDPALVLAVIKVESAFDAHAVSWAGARGLMQLMPGTAALMGVRNSFDPRENIMGGSGYLRRMLDRFNNDLKLALAAYNIGPERVAREGEIPNVKETKAYVKRVTELYRQYKKKK